MSLLKKTITAILIASMMLMASSLMISATTDTTVEQSFTLSEDIPEEDSLPDSDELLSAYLEKELYPSATFGRSAYDLLNDTEKQLYNAIKQKILSVAAGETTSTAFEITSGLDAFSWTAAELGVAQLVSGGSLTGAAQDAISTKIADIMTTGDIMRALTSDIPCELFWFDKTEGMNTGYSTSAQGSKAWVSRLVFTFYVSPDFKGANNTVTNPTKIAQINTAKQTAQSIVAKHASKSDFDKLTAYKEEICDLTDYYSGNLSGAYGNPWQLIWVFDNDPATDVVCEGYSKAFKYLCDLSEFSSSVYCYLVTGNMVTTSSSGPHMWNLVEINGKNYLVDVTNSDDGSIGDNGSLFMVGTTAKNDGATNHVGSLATYSYDVDNIGNYLNYGVFLPVSQTSYAHDSNHLFTVTVTGGEGSGSYASGATVTLTATPSLNQEFECWEVTGGNVLLGSILTETTTFVMPERNVTVQAIYHTHIPSDTQSYDDDEHWYELECGCVEKYQKAEHSYTKTVLKSTSCTEKGIEKFACDCGYEYEQEIDMLLHEYDDGVVTKEATADEVGTKKFTCQVCGDTYLDFIPKLTPSATDEDNNNSDTDSDHDDNETETYGDDDLYEEPTIFNGCDASVSTTAIALVCALGLAITTKKRKV